MNLQSIKDRLARPAVYEVSLSEVRWLIERLEAAEKALAMADVHIGWGDCTLENVHAIVRAALKEKP